MPMSLDPLLISELAVLGLCTGFLAGLLGIGGGMIMVPFISAILGNRGVAPGLAVKMAIATSMATIIFTSISSVRAHHQRGAVRWDIARRLAPGIVMGAAVASLGVFAVLKGASLALFFALFVSFSATQMLLDKKPQASRTLPGSAGQLGAGAVIGFLSGLVGAWRRIRQRAFHDLVQHRHPQRCGHQRGAGFSIALANAVGYVVSGQGVAGRPEASLGYVYLPALLVIAIASVLMAPLGVKAAHALPVKSLKRVFAGVLFILAAYMLYKGMTI